MPADALSVLQAAVTKVTSFTSASLDLKTGTPRRGLKARFNITNYSGASAGHTWTPKVMGSSDDTTFVLIAQGDPLTTTTAAQTKEAFVPFETSYRYVKSQMDVSGTTGTPTISYSVDIMPARPG